MPSFTKSRSIILIVAVIVVMAVAGVALSWGKLRETVAAMTSASTAGSADGHAGHDHSGHDHAGHDHGSGGEESGAVDEVDLSPTARQNLKLKTGRVKLSDYIRTLHIPGEIIEAPGYSTADVPARVAGIVSKIYAAPGQAVRPGMPLFSLDLTGEALAEAQSRLLDDLQQLATTQAELDRLGPLTQSGAAADKKRLELEYDRRRIEGQRNTRIQELLIRGLSRAQVDDIVTNRQLVQSVTVVVPQYPELTATDADTPADLETPASNSSQTDDWEYTIESINVHPGQSVTPETSLARLARHTRLHVRGHAFERDLPVVAALGPGQSVAIEFGSAEHSGIDGVFGTVPEEDHPGHGDVLEGQSLLYIDNHVDPKTQAYSFYVPLTNEVLRDSTDERGRVFRSWRYKPGQRVHVRVPVERLTDRMVLPADAVVTDGPESFVFRLTGRHTVGEGPDGKRLYDEMYKAIPVVVAHRDSRQIVIAPGGELKNGDLIAMNRAYQLRLAMKNATEGGGGHHHGHNH